MAELSYLRQNLPYYPYDMIPRSPIIAFLVVLPLLRVAADGKIHTVRDAIDTLANQFGLSEQERKELLPSGTDRVFDNRIG